MPTNDARSEELQAVLPRTLLLGLMILPGLDAPSSTDCPIKVTPGVAVIDGCAAQIVGDDDLDVESGTLSDLSEKWHAIVAYRNTAVNGVFLTVVSAAEALVADGTAVQPTDTEIEAAIATIVGAGAEYGYTLVGCVKFSRSGVVVTLDSIDYQVRSFEIPTDRKDPAAAYNFVDVSQASVYVFDSIQYLGSVDAASIAAADVVTDFPLPPVHGRIRKFRAVCETAVTTGAKGADLNLEIGTTDVTGGVIDLDGTHALGAVSEGSAITAGNTFVPGDILSVEGADVTTFTEGRFGLYVEIERLVLG